MVGNIVVHSIRMTPDQVPVYTNCTELLFLFEAYFRSSWRIVSDSERNGVLLMSVKSRLSDTVEPAALLQIRIHDGTISCSCHVMIYRDIGKFKDAQSVEIGSCVPYIITSGGLCVRQVVQAKRI